MIQHIGNVAVSRAMATAPAAVSKDHKSRCPLGQRKIGLKLNFARRDADCEMLRFRGWVPHIQYFLWNGFCMPRARGRFQYGLCFLRYPPPAFIRLAAFGQTLRLKYADSRYPRGDLHAAC